MTTTFSLTTNTMAPFTLKWGIMATGGIAQSASPSLESLAF